jgi:hypothetical protein
VEVAPACLALEAQNHLGVLGGASCLAVLVVHSCLGGQGVGPCLLVLLLPSFEEHQSLGNPMQQAHAKNVSKGNRKPCWRGCLLMESHTC